ncbi:MAG: phosphoglucosamine mutase [Oscillospiraceae bacterium]|jgi:phosphoglucosamine mutase|nr:phosphoglucosamine mutase [Oscillospiraceae bacterium]
MGKYFGTDGVRGIANEGLDPELAFRLGHAAATALTDEAGGRQDIIIGKDTRISSDMLEAALAAGVASAGARAVLLGVAPTPAVAFAAKENGAAGIVISASHNPYEYNGIKIIDRQGYKLPDKTEERVEALMGETPALKKGREIGGIVRDTALLDAYCDSLLRAADGGKYSGLSAVFDCANGAACATAERVFGKIGLKRRGFINTAPDGANINNRCGSTNRAALCEAVLAGGYDVGLAFDGDADRCLAADEGGAPMDGDAMLALLALGERKAGLLERDTLVTTIMSNFGLYEWGKREGAVIKTVKVGDRYVLEEMLAGGYSVGGENSGHVIFLKYATTGDGQLTALKLLSLLGESGAAASVLAKTVSIYPQVLINVAVTPRAKERWESDARVREEIGKAEAALRGHGRVLVRASGTENLVRVMLEGKEQATVESLARNIASGIEVLC